MGVNLAGWVEKSRVNGKCREATRVPEALRMAASFREELPLGVAKGKSSRKKSSVILSEGEQERRFDPDAPPSLSRSNGLG
jgi:hypothetical protein